MSSSLLLLACVLPLQDDASQPAAPRPPVAQDVQQDHPSDQRDFTGIPGAPEHLQALDVENPNRMPRTNRAWQPKTEGPTVESGFSSLRIRDLLTAPSIDEPGDGRVWVRGRDYRASFGTEGFAFYPVFGKSSPQEYPVAFTFAGATVAGEQLGQESAALQRSDATVQLDHGGVREVYHIRLDEVEQTFVFDSLPGVGEIVVSMDIASELAASVVNGALTFRHPEFGYVSYGNAIAYDATGAQVDVERQFDGSSLRLIVPADFVSSAVLPLTIDPPVTAFASSFGAADDSYPDIAFDGTSDVYWVVWEEYTSAANGDCYATTFSAGGTTQGTSFAVEATSDSWQRPAIAYHYGADRLLVVAQATVGTSGRIAGRLIDGATNATTGGILTISTTGFNKLTPDVGGVDRDSLTNAHFCVVWAFEAGVGNRDVQYRVVDWDGTFVTGVTDVDTSATADDIHTTISKSTGDDTLLGDWWTIAWTRDTNADGRGQIMARRVVWSGAPGSGAGNFVVDSSTTNSWPSVTSRLDDNLVAVADRPSIVAYQTRFGALAGGFQHSIYARVVTDGQAFAENSLNFTLEDVDEELDQIFPSIATDGNAFYITYAEEFHGNVGSGDYDMYMVSGHLSQTNSNAYLALCERHQNMSFSASAELNGQVATRWDGEANSISDDGAVIWHDGGTTGTGGLLEGQILEVPTIDTSTIIAVGRQFCDANPNSLNSAYSADVSGWTWMDGDQTLGTTHRVYAVDVPPNQFGYLLASTTAANINLPGGSQGRLCQTGSGRYLAQIQNSGSSGTFVTTVNPLNLPQPTGPVAALPGQTWLFTYWHRDLNPGPTSNFTSGVRVMFAP